MKSAIIVVDGRRVFRECLCDSLSINLPETQVFSVGKARHAVELGFLPVSCILLADSADIEDMREAFPTASLLLVCEGLESETSDPQVSRLMLDMPSAIFMEIVRSAVQRGCTGMLGSGLALAPNGAGGELTPCATAKSPALPACDTSARAGQLPGSDAHPVRLSDREGEVLSALRRGLPNKLIAHEMDLSENTVKIHVRNVMRKLGVTNRTMAALYTLNESGHAVEAHLSH